MKVEVLYVPDCPHHSSAAKQLRNVLLAEGIRTEINEVAVVTEKHYSPWVRARQEQLEADLASAWSRDPVIALQTQGTRGVHGKNRRPN